ncbi:PAS domain-containing hybrid sensor histidine kinase/response regulator [Cryptosporangium aurantiacum]|uniref:histidine kinase n=1 Tax=Cryptosporangium aurantiacum TaxID=134849 RepID=A0A1M7RIU7_9ACTN|nr:PAS domain S-box protein [Cryptosporangium aurantiacum]SHN46100.1 PAS/PAC sensor hybrid histidine kinase [Cryptosporangium aurantiacum]
MGTLSFTAPLWADEHRPAALLALDADGRVALADTTAAELFGLPADDLLGRPLADLLAPPDQAHSADGLLHAEPGTVASTPFQRPDGSVFAATVTCGAIIGASGGLTALGIRMTEGYGAAQSWLVGIVRSARDAIIGESLDGRVTSWNAAAEHLYGYTEEEMLGRRMADLYPAESRSEEEEILRRISHGESVEIYEAQRLHRYGHRMMVELSVSPVTDAAGRIVGAARVSRDVTARHRDEAKFRWLLDATSLAIIGVDGGGVIQLVNAQAQHLFGYSAEQLQGQPVEILLPEEFRDRHAEHRAIYATDPRMRRMGEGLQLSARRADGSRFPAEISLASIQTDEGLLIAATVHDISARLEQEVEHRRLENELQRSQRLDSLGQLAGGVAHDFNNVLAIISTHASILEEDLEEAAAGALDGAREAVAQVLAASERGARLTRQLLAFGRREIVRPEVFDLNDVVRDVQRMLTGTLGADVVLSAAQSARPAAVTADAGRIEQVLVNLAVNARDAMPAGGSLSVHVDHTVLGPVEAAQHGLERGQYVRLRVTDTGTGMTPEVAERAFEPFFSTKAEGQGTGLGLASVYGIIAQAGGAVGLDSTPGVGTTVTILLPSADEVALGVADEPDTADSDASGRPGYGTILLVDDERELRASIETILVRVGYTVLSAASGAEAIEIASSYRGQLDLLLTDITMPGLSGREVADQVRSLHPTVQVLYMSGFAQRLLTSKGTIDPEVTLIEKPFNRRDLLSAIEDVLRLPV